MSLLRRLSTRRYPHLLLSAGVCSYRSINPSATVAAVDRRDRQTDRRTDARQLQRLCSAYYDDAQLFAYGYADILATDFMLLGSSFCWFTAHRFNQYNVEGRRHGPRRAILSNIPRGRLFARNLWDDLSCDPRMIFTGRSFFHKVMDGRIELVFGMDATFGILHCVVRKFGYLQK